MDNDFKINIYKWRGEDRVDLELSFGDYRPPVELGFESVAIARDFVKKLQSAEVRKLNVKENGEVEE